MPSHAAAPNAIPDPDMLHEGSPLLSNDSGPKLRRVSSGGRLKDNIRRRSRSLANLLHLPSPRLSHVEFGEQDDGEEGSPVKAQDDQRPMYTSYDRQLQDELAAEGSGVRAWTRSFDTIDW